MYHSLRPQDLEDLKIKAGYGEAPVSVSRPLFHALVAMAEDAQDVDRLRELVEELESEIRDLKDENRSLQKAFD